MKPFTLLTLIISMILIGCAVDTGESVLEGYTISTFAGTDSDIRDGGPATSAQLTFPYGVTKDSRGNVYIADSFNHRVRKVDTNGIITTFAGTGEEGYGGDGGPASEAQLKWPTGVAVDEDGAVYIADRNNERVRKVDTNGIITTFAGNGEWGYDTDHEGKPASEATLNWPTGITLDEDGNLYIADTYNHRIRKVDTNGIITTIAGRSHTDEDKDEDSKDSIKIGDGGPAIEAKLNWPNGVAVDDAGNLYIADWDNHRIRKVNNINSGNPDQMIISTIVGTGEEGYSGDGQPATGAQLNRPNGLDLDGNGNLYIADQKNNRIRKISNIDDPDGGNRIITSIAGGDDGSDSGVTLSGIRGVAVDAEGNVYIANTPNHQILELDTNTAEIIVFAGTGNIGDGGPATNARLLHPTGLTLDTDSNVYITDTLNNRVRKVDIHGIITTIAGTGEEGDGGDGGPATSAQLHAPGGIAVDTHGNLYISDRGNHKIRKIDASGIITTFAGTGDRGDVDKDGDVGDGGPATSAQLFFPDGIAVHPDGSLYIADSYNNRIRKVDRAGIITTIAGLGVRSFSGDDGPATEAHLGRPSGLEIDGEGNIYISDLYDRNRIRKIDTAGIITTIAQTASAGLLTVGMDGSVYITESPVGRVLKLDPSGVLSIIAGTAEPGYGGDDGPATGAQLDGPSGIEVDADGNIYVADTKNNRVRKLTLTGTD